MRSNISMDLDGALAGRNAGEHDYRQVARSGNLAEDLKPFALSDGGLAAIDQKTLMIVGASLVLGWFISKKM